MRRVTLVLVAACRIGFDPIAGDDGGPTGDGGGDSDGRVKLAAGIEHTCLIRGTSLYCFGSNGMGQLGVNDVVSRDLPTLVPGDWIEVAAGQEHTCAVDTQGGLWCWGGNVHGELGVGDTNPRLVPTQVTTLTTPVRYVDATSFHTCAVLENGVLIGFGENAEGQLGQGDLPNAADIPTPIPMSAQAGFTDVACGYAHTIGTQNGTIFGTGRNTSWQLGLGNGSANQYRVLTEIDTGPWNVITGGQDLSCGVRGTDLYCWGINDNMQNGTGDAIIRYVPVAINTTLFWLDVEVDTFGGCALAEDAEMYCWGRNVEGQLGLGDQVDRFIPTRTGSNWKSVSVGRFHACGERRDGKFWCAGKGSSGQLGIGPAGNTPSWTQVMLPPT